MRETIRAWTEATETFVLEVIFEQRAGKLAALVRSILFGLSKVFQVAVKARRFLYNVRILRDSGFAWSYCPDHMPLHADDPKGFQGYAHGFGYIQALIDAANAEVAV